MNNLDLIESITIKLKSYLEIRKKLSFFKKKEMGKIENFSISLEKKNPIYFLREQVEGNVSFKVTDRIKCNSIFITLTGTAKVDWYRLFSFIFFRSSF